MSVDTIDPEKGLLSSAARPISTLTTRTAPTSNNISNNTQHGPTQSSLELFQCLVGINTPASLTHIKPSTATRDSQSVPLERNGNNIGLYQHAKTEERRARISYILTSYISNTLYMLQILLAATFTALSAYKDSDPVTLTVLGAVTTVVSGSLAWQKGQGVPQRYRKAQDQYQALIVEIEMAERSFVEASTNTTADGNELDPSAEMKRLYKLFDTAKADQQANYPDLYVSTGATTAKDAKEISTSVAKQVEDAKAEARAEAEKVQKEIMAKIEELVKELRGEDCDQG